MSRCSRPICLTAWLLAATLAQASPPQSGEAQPTPKPAVSESKIEQVIKRPITLSFQDAPLSAVLDDLHTTQGINIVLDLPALKEDAIDRESPVSIRLEEVSLRSALNLILRQCQLTWVIKDDVVVVTTEKYAHGKLKQVAYQVADLVVPVNRSPVVLAFGDVVKVERPTATKPATTENELIRLITSTIAPRSWAEMGGPGTIDYHPLTMSLVVNQSADIQEQVADLLAALQRLQDLEVSLEIRVLRLSAEFCERKGLNPEGDATKLLKPEEFARLLTAAREDPTTNVMQAPKLTLFNGQQAIFHFEEAGKGLSLNLLPNVSADRRFVKLEMMRGLWNPQSGEGFSKRLEIPDGATVVSGCWTETREAASEPPVLSKIPYVNRLFRNVQIQRAERTEKVLVCVTPRVVVQEEEEVRQTAFVRPPDAEAVKDPSPVEQVRSLVRQYHQACAEGDLKKAKKLARKALALDPTCFGKQP
jgi:type II secretory pathway component GspD/PulD (secretin)